jgi:hypothetical protein
MNNTNINFSFELRVSYLELKRKIFVKFVLFVVKIWFLREKIKDFVLFLVKYLQVTVKTRKEAENISASS